ncbi:MAG: class II fructose-bisphosphate aldolase [bacterium]
MIRKPDELIINAWKAKTVIPAFNIPYLPMMEPVIKVLRDTECFAFIAVARLEWEKFEAGGLKEIFKEYQRIKDEKYTRLHLDHIPVIDEDGLQVEYESVIKQALQIGYQSVMVDGSRLSLAENIKATKKVVDMAHARGIPVEGELGAVLGHEQGTLPPYDELFSSGKGFTDSNEAERFVKETNVNWLSVAVGNIHGSISGAAKDVKKIAARIDIEHLKKIREQVSIPLVLHGGSGINKRYILDAVKNGIAKINIGTAIRQVYENFYHNSVALAQEAVYEKTVQIIREELEIEGSVKIINP